MYQWFILFTAEYCLSQGHTIVYSLSPVNEHLGCFHLWVLRIRLLCPFCTCLLVDIWAYFLWINTQECNSSHKVDSYLLDSTPNFLIQQYHWALRLVVFESISEVFSIIFHFFSHRGNFRVIDSKCLIYEIRKQNES